MLDVQHSGLRNVQIFFSCCNVKELRFPALCIRVTATGPRNLEINPLISVGFGTPSPFSQLIELPGNSPKTGVVYQAGKIRCRGAI